MAARVKDWKKFQHFKDRRPPWIKLSRDLLDDPDWHELSGDEAKALVMIWLVASENGGNLPDNRKLAFRLRIGEREVETLLKYLSNWLDRDDIETTSSHYPAGSSESVGEAEKRTSLLCHEETSRAPPTNSTGESPDTPLALHEIGRWRSALKSDGDATGPECPKAGQNTVRVTPGTPQWDAWLAHYASRNKLTHRLMSEAGDFNLHFLVPSEYPPSET